MADLSMYQTLGRKLGIMETNVIRKAAELKNLLEIRGGNMSLAALRVSDTASIVLCLEIACTLLSRPVSKEEALKLSGLKRTAYQMALKSLERVLDVNMQTSLRELAVQFGCLQGLHMATGLLSRYEREQCCDVETNGSLFQAAALLCACRRQKIKVEEARLREVSGVKRSTLERLLAQMDKIADVMQAEAAQVKAAPVQKKRTLLDDIESAESATLECQNAKKTKMEKDLDYYKNVNYNEWKRKLLAKAVQDTEECKT